MAQSASDFLDDKPAGGGSAAAFLDSDSAEDFLGEAPPSPYSRQASQAAVEAEAGRRRRREEFEAELAAPKITVGLRKPSLRGTLNFLTGGLVDAPPLPADDDFLVRPVRVNPEAVSFISEAIKSSPSTAAGIAAASAATPLANRVRLIPGAVGQIGGAATQLGAGALAAIGTRLGQEAVLPEILPESLEQAYRVSGEIAAENPNSALLGQIAGGAPFFRPGLPINSTGGARVAVPAITGAIGGGIEGANQIIEGDLDVQRLALATAASALMNRETALGARIGPNLVLPNAQTRLLPTELEAQGRLLREPIIQSPEGIPPTNQILPDELAVMGRARAEAESAAGARTVEGERSVANMDAGIDAEKVRRLGERMMGQTPQDKLAILDQELRLQKDTLSLAEQRAGLDAKIALKQQIEQQRALEDAARQEQQAAKEAQKAQQAALTPPEPPKSQQILEQSAKPPPLANVATEIATQTKQSPFALQDGVNKMTQVEAPAPALPQVVEPGTPAPATFVGIQEGIPGNPKFPDRELYNLTQDIPSHNAGSTVSRETLEKAGYEVPKQAKAEVVSDQYSLKAPKPLAESLGTVKDALAYRKERIDNYKKALKAEIGLSDEQAERLSGLLSRDRDTGRFERTLTQQQRDRLEAFFDGPMNQKGGPLEQWDNSIPEIEEIASATDKEWLSDKIVGSLGNVGRPPSFEPSDRFLSPVLALNRLKEIGGTWEDVFNQVLSKTRRMGAGNDTAELARAYSASIKKFADDNGLQLPMKMEAIGSARPASAELRLNNAGLDLPPISSLTAAQKRAELEAAGIKTYNGKPLSEANPAQLSNALGKHRRGQLERGAISARVLSPIAGMAAGGSTAGALTEQQQGESDEEFKRRRLRNILIGIAFGGPGGVALGSLGRFSKSKSAIPRPATPGGRVALPDVGPGEGIRQTAEKVIKNTSYPEQMRQMLSEDPEIVYETISRNRIRDLTKGATDEELVKMLSSPDPNLRIGALIQQANRASVTPGMEEEAARLIREVSKNFTSPAQLLGMGSLVESPQAMVQAVEDSLNLPGTAKDKIRSMTPAVRDKLLDLSKRNIQAEQRHARAERMARENLNDATAAELKAATDELGASKKALADYTKDILPESMGNIVSKIIKGNLLAPLSFAKNMFGNAAWQALLRGRDSIGSALDAVYSTATGRPRAIMLGNPLPSADELKALAGAVRVASKEMLTGPSEQSYIKTEVQRGFHPLRAMVQMMDGMEPGKALEMMGFPLPKNEGPVSLPGASGLMDKFGIAALPRNPEGKIPAGDRFKKFIEAVLGPAPEASFRMLNLGDKPVRLVTETRLLNEAADLRGLTGDARKKFIALPDEATKTRIEAEGRGGIMAQRNRVAQKVGSLFDTWLVETFDALTNGKAPESIVNVVKDVNKVTGTLQLPYREFPANFVTTSLNFAMPPVAMLRATIQASAGNRREAMQNMGEAVMGSMFYAAAYYLWEKGLITPPLDPRDKKRRQAQYEMGANRFNVSGLERLEAGGDPKYRRGDTTVDWTTIGPAAASFYVFTRRKAMEENKAARTGDAAQPGGMLGAMLDASGAANFAFDQSFLVGTNGFLEALKDWETFGDNFVQNTFRAITAIPVPATAEALAKTQYKFIPELKGDTLDETLKNVWEYKTMELPQDARSNLKRDMWGEPLVRTPDGRNPYLYQFLDVSRAETKSPDPFKQVLLELYQQTNSTDVYPGLVGDTLSNNGVTVDLTAKDYDDLQRLVGAMRKDFAKRIVADRRFSDPKTIPENKLLALSAAYDEGAKAGKQLFLSRPSTKALYPELYGLPSVPGKSRVIARDIKARGRLRMDRDEANQP